LISGIRARLLAGGQVDVGLHGALLHGHGLAARVVGVDGLRVALLGHPLGAGLEVADHRGLRHALVVHREARDTDVVLAALDAEDDRVEGGGNPLGLDPELGHDRVEEVDVHADDGLAVGVEELVGLVGGVGADLDDAGALDALGELGDQGLVDGRGARRRFGSGARVTLGEGVGTTGGQGEAVEATAARASARVRNMCVLSRGRAAGGATRHGGTRAILPPPGPAHVTPR
jgi:hypothetical protein